ncbi:MAG: putative lipid II flippase FtsW [Chloroflexi bacterium]|nr:putative lipid II flippase FtsW [Chloroflexota bacterium]
MLLVVGLLAVYSASFAIGHLEYGDTNYFVARQALFALAGLGAMLLFMRMDYRRLRVLSVPMMAVALVSLLAVLIPGIGVERNGAARWLDLGVIDVQPSEFAKLAIIIYISAWLASRRDKINDFSLGFVPFVLMMGLIGGLVVVEPDMGTAIVIILVTSTLFFVAGAPVSHLLLLIVMGALISWGLVLTQEYRLARLDSFLAAESDPQGNGYHILQLLIALGSGGPAGLGWGASRQKFFYVPGAHTDGVFAIIGEELGFIGAMVVIGLFAFLIYRALKVTVKAPDQFGLLLGMGVISWVAYQALINIGGITRTIPLTGIPLPFLSYGGSSLIAVMAAVGVLLSISRHMTERDPSRPDVPRAWTRRASYGRQRA